MRRLVGLSLDFNHVGLLSGLVSLEFFSFDGGRVHILEGTHRTSFAVTAPYIRLLET